MSGIGRVIIIGWDGAGNFVREARTPYLDRIIQRGTVSYEATTVLPSISAQCWGALLHGVNPEQHGLTNGKAAAGTFPDDSAYPSVFRIAREAHPDWKLASFCAWDPINYGIIEPSLGVHKVSVPDDGELAAAAADYIRSNPDVKLMYVDFDGPDAAGHRHGYNTSGQIAAIEQADVHTGMLLEAMEEAGILEDSLIVVVSDHGGGGERANDHGSAHPLDATIFWACVGPGVLPGAVVPGINIKDTAAVAAYALGLQAPPAWEARLPQGLFAQ